jgi:hypothetical protein
MPARPLGVVDNRRQHRQTSQDPRAAFALAVRSRSAGLHRSDRAERLRTSLGQFGMSAAFATVDKSARSCAVTRESEPGARRVPSA